MYSHWYIYVCNPSRYGCLALNSLHFTLRALCTCIGAFCIVRSHRRVSHARRNLRLRRGLAAPIPHRKLDVDLPGSSGSHRSRRRRHAAHSFKDAGGAQTKTRPNAPVGLGLGSRSGRSVKSQPYTTFSVWAPNLQERQGPEERRSTFGPVVYSFPLSFFCAPGHTYTGKKIMMRDQIS